MRKISLLVGFVALLHLSNAQAMVFNFDGTLDLYENATNVASENVKGIFSFTAEPYKSDFSGVFEGVLFSLPLTGNLTIPNSISNTIQSPFEMTWNSQLFSGDLLIDVNIISLDLIQITTLDGDSDGIPGSVVAIGLKSSSSVALTGQFSVVPLPPAIWLFGPGLAAFISIFRRKVTSETD